jgi:hypothetical protein
MNESIRNKAFHLVYTEDDIKADIEKSRLENNNQLKVIIDKLAALENVVQQLSREWNSVHKELNQVQRDLHEWLSYVSTKQHLDVRQQNLNLRQAVPFRFVPQKSSTSTLLHMTPSSAFSMHKTNQALSSKNIISPSSSSSSSTCILSSPSSSSKSESIQDTDHTTTTTTTTTNANSSVLLD